MNNNFRQIPKLGANLNTILHEDSISNPDNNDDLINSLTKSIEDHSSSEFTAHSDNSELNESSKNEIDFELDNDISQDITEAIIREISSDTQLDSGSDVHKELQNTIQDNKTYTNAPENTDKNVDFSSDDVEKLLKLPSLNDPRLISEHHILPASELSLPILDQPLDAHSGNEEQLQVQALERWLDKPITDSNTHNFFNQTLILSALFIFGIIALPLIFFLNPFSTTPRPLDNFVQLHPNKNSLVPSNTGLRDQVLQDFKMFSDSKPSSLKHPHQDDGNKVSMAMVSGTNIGNPILNCPKPKITLSAIPAGFTKISVSSKCHSNQSLKIKYDRVVFNRDLDSEGKLEFALDCFAGDRKPIRFIFEDKMEFQKYPITVNMDQISKVAVIWNSQNDINLHAYEYSPAANKSNHLWQNKTSSYSVASKITNSTNNGHGFISSVSNISDNKIQKIEVYTYLHPASEVNQVIKLALSYRTHKKPQVSTASCKNQKDSHINYETTHLIRNGDLQLSSGSLLINDCDLSLQDQTKSKAIADLEIRN